MSYATCQRQAQMMVQATCKKAKDTVKQRTLGGQTSHVSFIKSFGFRIIVLLYKAIQIKAEDKSELTRTHTNSL